MAVTLSIIELLDAIRVGHTAAEMAQGSRLRDYATTAVLRYAPSAPDVVHDEAAILIAGYLFDKPTAQGGAGFAAAGRNSGAWSALNPYRKHRAGSVAGSVDTPDLGQIDEDAINALIQSAVAAWARAGTTDEIPAAKLPAGMGGDGTDETARAAAAAQADAAAAQATATQALSAAATAASAASSANTAAEEAAAAAEAAQVTADGAATFAALAGSGIDGHTLLITANRAAAAAAQADADSAQAAAEASAAAAAAAQATADSAGGGGIVVLFSIYKRAIRGGDSQDGQPAQLPSGRTCRLCSSAGSGTERHSSTIGRSFFGK